MEKYSKITIDKAVQLTEKCICCNSITEIEEALNSYNKKNGTNYVIEIKSGEKVEFISGKDVGEYLASNLEKFK